MAQINSIGTPPITLAGIFTMAGAFSFTGTLTNTTTVTFPTSGTLATTSQLPTLPLSLSDGGTNASLTASNGGILYSTATALAILAGTATARQMLQSGATGAPAWSTSTYPATNAINTLLYASAANVMAALATANNGILITNGTGVPSIGNTVGAGLTMPSITFNTTTGVVGTTTNDNAAAGSVGEIIESTVLVGSAVSVSSNTAKDITSISLTAGDWDVWGNIWTNPNAATTTSIVSGWINTTSNTAPTSPGAGAYSANQYAAVAGAANGLFIGQRRLSLSTTTTVYLGASIQFAVNVMSVFGYIGARRRR